MSEKKDIFEEISKDTELRQLLMEAFKWRGWARLDCAGACLCSQKIIELANKLYEKTGIEIMEYC
jgi:hypothetical protein